jgi:hypothetical protein
MCKKGKALTAFRRHRVQRDRRSIVGCGATQGQFLTTKELLILMGSYHGRIMEYNGESTLDSWCTYRVSMAVGSEVEAI